MSKKGAELIRISRLLTPKHRADLRDWVDLASVAENSARESLEPPASFGCVNSPEPQEYSCGDSLKRSKK